MLVKIALISYFKKDKLTIPPIPQIKALIYIYDKARAVVENLSIVRNVKIRSSSEIYFIKPLDGSTGRACVREHPSSRGRKI